ncbi:hypothetical protein EDB81DRAFT_861957 [Dactylonectria macrodidyma]|uniref:Uncharacterized protein n=1 Tax=Dactylonectria macrodidyma TaxID=307937 RepID=A0A9P9DGI2_9HYPO|nr:hypothetical protein EDB81DRAFT_861957 [Dactylonectria macrodidyma]
MARSHNGSSEGEQSRQVPPPTGLTTIPKKKRFSTSPQDIEQLDKMTMSAWLKEPSNTKATGWGIRDAHLLSQKATQEVLETLTSSGLTDDEAEPPDPWDASRPQRKSSGLTSQHRQGSRRGSPPPTSSATDDSSDDDAEAARRSRRERSQVATMVGTDAHRKIRKEAIGLFDPDFKDPKGTGLVVSQNKQIYTDVYLFCEHLRVFERYGEDSLQEYYVSMLLGGGAQGWFMGELSTDQRNRLLDARIYKFCKKLTARFKRPDAEITKDLHSGRYTLGLAQDDISLTQWVQRKAAYAKQLGLQNDKHILQAIYPLIDIEISRLLTIPKAKTNLIDFIRECEDLRPTITALIQRRRGRRDDHFNSRRDYERSDQKRDYDNNRRSNRDRSRRYEDRDQDRDRYRAPRDNHENRGTDDRRNRPRDSYRDRDRQERSEKRVTFEKKYPAIESEPEPEPEPRRERAPTTSDADDEDDASLSDASTFSTRSQQAYVVAMNGSIFDLPTDPAFKCETCQRSFPSKMILKEHCIANCCVTPQQAAREKLDYTPKPSRCKRCRESFPSRNRLFQHLETCRGTAATRQAALTATTAASPVPGSLLEPKPCAPSEDYTHLRLKAKAHAKDDQSVEICGDSGCGRPVIDRTWLQSLDHTIEKRDPAIIKGVSGWKRTDEWATFTFYLEGIHADGTKAGTAKFTTGAWVQDKLDAVALLGNGFLDPYNKKLMCNRACCTLY